MRRAGSGAGRRWGVAAALVGVLVALPPLVGALPASDADVPAVELRDAALASAGVGFTGFAESAGGLTLPVGSRRFTNVADLFSDRTRMRVWWRGATDARVDVVTAGGETGYHSGVGGGWTWTYEDDRAVRSSPDVLHLPRPPDLLPAPLGRRLLSEAADDELSRIGARRLAGRDALGVRVTPSAPAASVDRVDVWVDAATGLPLQVELFAAGSDRPWLDTRFLYLDPTPPPAEVTAFEPPPGALVTSGGEDDLLDRARQGLEWAPLPRTLAGLPRRTADGVPRSVGLYGRGVTLLAVFPVPDGVAFDLADGLRDVPDAVEEEGVVRAAVGPLGVMLLRSPASSTYLVTGTVTLDALADAAAGLGRRGVGR